MKRKSLDEEREHKKVIENKNGKYKIIGRIYDKGGKTMFGTLNILDKKLSFYTLPNKYYFNTDPNKRNKTPRFFIFEDTMNLSKNPPSLDTIGEGANKDDRLNKVIDLRIKEKREEDINNDIVGAGDNLGTDGKAEEPGQEPKE